MKKIDVSSFFKKVSAKQVEVDVTLADRLGAKREDLKWSFQGYEASDIAELSGTDKEKLAFLANKMLEAFGRELIADNASDWTFSPTVTLGAAYDYYNQESERKRTLTKITALAFGQVYARYAPKLIGVESAAALALGTQVIPEWLKYSKEDKIRQTVKARLEAFSNAFLASEDEELQEIMSDKIEVLMALIKAFSEKEEKITITADAL